MEVTPMNDHPDILQKLVPGIIDIFQQSVYRIFLYGSVARGTQTPGSDIDIAVIVRSHTKEMHSRLHKRSVHLPL